MLAPSGQNRSEPLDAFEIILNITMSVMRLASLVYGVRRVRPQVPKRTRKSDLTVDCLNQCVSRFNRTVAL